MRELLVGFAAVSFLTMLATASDRPQFEGRLTEQQPTKQFVDFVSAANPEQAIRRLQSRYPRAEVLVLYGGIVQPADPSEKFYGGLLRITGRSRRD
jgi:hypothetical protein